MSEVSKFSVKKRVISDATDMKHMVTYDLSFTLVCTYALSIETLACPLISGHFTKSKRRRFTQNRYRKLLTLILSAVPQRVAIRFLICDGFDKMHTIRETSFDVYYRKVKPQ